MGNVFAENQLVFHSIVVAGLFQRSYGSSPIRSVVGIGDGDLSHGRIEEDLPANVSTKLGISGDPDHDVTDRVLMGTVGENKAGVAELAGVIAVGGKENVERSAVLNLREEVAAGAEGKIEFDARLFFVDGGEIGEGEFEVGGGGDVKLGLLSG